MVETIDLITGTKQGDGITEGNIIATVDLTSLVNGNTYYVYVRHSGSGGGTTCQFLFK